MKRFNHTLIILGLSILFLLLTFFIELVRENVFYSLIGILVLYLIVYWRVHEKYERFDVYLILIILSSFLISRLIFNNLDQATLTLRTSSTLAYISLHLVLMIGPWSRFSDRIQKIYYYRRHLGVTVFLLGTLHASIILPKYFSYSLEGALSSIFTFYGFTSLLLFFWLAVTSWDYLQKTIKEVWWKLLHGILLLIYMSLAYYMYNLQKSFNEPTLNNHLIIIGIFLLIWIIIAPYSLIKKMMNTYVFGWKQLHVLIWIIYISLILHVSFGALTNVNSSVVIIFWLGVILVFSSHIVGWTKKIYEDKKIYQKINSINKKIIIDGKEFIGVSKIDEFEESKGKKVYINKQPIAVFKTNGNFIAISDICKHQKGPIHKGKVSYGTVECPWHYWVYNLKDGCYTGKENFCLPVYETKVKDNILFISLQPKS